MTADSPPSPTQWVADGALHLSSGAEMADRTQASEHSPIAQSPAMASLWTDASHWVWDTLHRTVITVDPKRKSPYDMWNGSLPRWSSSFFIARLLQCKQVEQVTQQSGKLWFFSAPCTTTLQTT